MEIERKYLIPSLPDQSKLLDGIEYEQAYLCTEPVIRIRREGEEYWLTYKSAGLMIREEANLPLTEEAYRHLLPKTDGYLISKTRYFLFYDEHHTIELDLFRGRLQGLVTAEVEFLSEDDANHFTPPDWFGKEVTFDGRYHNSSLSRLDSLESLQQTLS